MRTRSKSSQPSSLYPLLEKVEQKSLVQPFLKVEMDFDESSKAWKANKKSMGNGRYKYICTKLTKT